MAYNHLRKESIAVPKEIRFEVLTIRTASDGALPHEKESMCHRSLFLLVRQGVDEEVTENVVSLRKVIFLILRLGNGASASE